RHAGLSNLMQALEERVYGGVGEGVSVGVNAPLVFDGSVTQWLQLSRGRRLELGPERVRPDGEALWRLVRERGVEGLDCTPSQLLVLLLAGGRGRAASSPLRRVVVGGEEIGSGLWERLVSREVLGLEYHNVYGPTECTVDATQQRLEPGREP